mgnify:CR=1 FL=1
MAGFTSNWMAPTGNQIYSSAGSLLGYSGYSGFNPAGTGIVSFDGNTLGFKSDAGFVPFGPNKDAEASIGNAALYAGIAQAIGSAAVGYYTSRLNKIQNKWASVIAEENAKRAELQAQDALRASQIRVGEISRKAQQVKSGQKVAMAANGIAMTGGTYAEVLTSTDIYKDESIREETLRGYREAWGYRMQGVNYSGQAGAYASASKSSNPLASAAGGLMSGALGAANTYAKFKVGGFF